jgi:uncharacterized membrane protein
MWETIKKRLTSPVVIIEILAAAAMFAKAVTGTDFGPLADTLAGLVTALFAVFAAINNPENKHTF